MSKKVSELLAMAAEQVRTSTMDFEYTKAVGTAGFIDDCVVVIIGRKSSANKICAELGLRRVDHPKNIKTKK
jgi:hypothetical protein